MDKFKTSSVFFTVALMLTTATASADDLEIYDKALSKPKILFVLDASGSMGVRDGGPTSRMTRMKDAMAALLTNIRGVDVGLMKYTSRGIELIHEVVDVETNMATLLAANATLTAGGGTPTVAAMLEAQRYLSGGVPYRGTEPNGLPTYQQPATNQCESNHIVLLTDGRPTSDTTVVNDLRPLIGNCASEGGGTCGAELAGYMANVDQFSTIPGNNHITVHSIGFNIVSNWLESVAIAGGGIYRNAASSQELLEVFRSILDTVQLTSTAAAPTVSVNAFNQSRHRNELFYSLFQPGAFPRWEGNIKKYRLVDGVIVDANNQPIINGGTLEPTSASLWSVDSNGLPEPDGATVQEGGMAALQPAARNWYTEGGNTTSGRATPQQITSNAQVAAAWLGATSNAERDTLVQWVRGHDSIDRDGDGNSTEPNHYVADSIHSSPVLVTYQSQESTGLAREALFAVNNMGVLHALDPLTGNELWSYTPGELLPNIKQYVDNSGTDHVYGLDGVIAVDIDYKSASTLDIDTESVRLFLTQRRGGSHIFAVDVSDPFSGTPIERLWKIEGGISGTDFRDLAQTWSTPRVVPVKYGCPTNCEIKEVLLFGGGYNPLYDNEGIGYPVPRPAVGHGNAIYMVDPETGQLLWSAGNGAHHALNLPMNDSVPDTPVPIDTDGDGAVNIIFFADIAGHVWRVDLDQAADTAANMAISGGMIASLNESGQRLRFFNRPDVSINGTTNGTANFNISIGSGMRSSPTYREATNNRLFVFKDSWVFSNPTAFNAATGSNDPDYRYVTNPSGSRSIITPASLSGSGSPTAYGYYRNLPIGEKILQPTLTTASRIFLTTYVPPSPGAIDPCAYQTGESRLYIYDLETADNKLPVSYGADFLVVGAGILDSGTIVDTGDSGGPDLLIGTTSEKLIDLLDPDAPNIYRRFFRTGWSEVDD